MDQTCTLEGFLTAFNSAILIKPNLLKPSGR